MKKVIIFDLDNTLVDLDFETMDCHDDFMDLLGLDLSKKTEVISEIMNFFRAFDKHFSGKVVTMRETKNLLRGGVCPFVKKYNLSIDTVIRALFDATIGAAREIDGASEILTYSKNKEYTLIILTNWFKYVQIGKLKLIGLDKFFDEVICVDGNYLKPNVKSLTTILSKFRAEDCVLIGNGYEKDIILGVKAGIDTIWIKSDNIRIKNNLATHNITNIKEIEKIL
ncbi:HAD family hydrolase [Candidatus Saccharibacteria bacterium]|nr:HAD family hydrolase [Candidatus Saccharibacteria bacterium]